MSNYSLFPSIPVANVQPVKRHVPPAYHKVVNKELAKRRYYYHRRIKAVFPIEGAQRTIDISPFQSLSELKPIYQKYINELIKLGYNFQTTIPCPPSKKQSNP